MIRRSGDMRSESRENMRGGDGRVTIQHCFEPPEFGAKVRLCSRLTLPPGAGIGMHPHVNEDEVFMVTRGTGVLDDGKTAVRVSAGDAILTGKGESHAIRNDGAEPLEIVAIIVCYP